MAARSLEPGRNCWRVERASTVLLHPGRRRLFPAGPAGAAARTQDGVHPRLGHHRAHRSAAGRRRPPDGPTRLDELLAFIARRRPELRCYILTWDYGALYTLERDPLSRWRLGWRMPRRVRFGFDDRHPARRLSSSEDRRRRRPAGVLRRHRPDRPSLGHERASRRRARRGRRRSARPTGRITKFRRW